MLKHYKSKFPSLYLTAHFTLWLKKIQRARHTPWPLSSAWEIPFQCMIDQLIPSWVTSSHSRKAPTRCGQPLTLHLFHVWVSLKKMSTFVNRNLLNQDKLNVMTALIMGSKAICWNKSTREISDLPWTHFHSTLTVTLPLCTTTLQSGIVILPVKACMGRNNNK